MAHLKTAAAARMNRDSLPKHLGIKLYGGQKAQPGAIIVRQKGTKFKPGAGTRMGGDYTIYSIQDGMVSFYRKLGKKYAAVV